MNQVTNWSAIMSELGRGTVRNFASGRLSGWRGLYRKAVYSPVGGEVRSLLRNRGVDDARRLARKALNRS